MSEEPRVRALLRLSSFGDDVTPTDADPTGADIGADEAFGYTFAPTGVVAVVYSFFDIDEVEAADEQVRAAVPADQDVATTSNGLLLLRASGTKSDDAARELVRALITGFAGRE